VARFGDQRQISLLMLAGLIATGVAGIIYGLAGSVVVIALVLLAAGAGESALFAAYDTLLLIRLPDEMRGRVMGLMFTLAAMFPLGAIVAGAAAEVVGLRAVAVAEGVVILGLTVLGWFTVLRNTVTEGPARAV
jgi:MFS family permease